MEQGRNPQAARDHNRSLMLRLVRDRGPISRAELARASLLSKPAVTDIVDGLIRHELVRETVKGDVAVGRKPILLEINREAMWAIGIDLSRDHVDLLITDLMGSVCRFMSRRISFDDEDEGYPERVAKCVTDVIRDSGVPASRIAGIGVGYPMPLSHVRRMIVCDGQMVGWKTVQLKQLIEREFGVPVYLDNDANVAALHERWHGVADSFRDYLFILVGNGVGLGIVLGGAVYRGASGIAGEIGHMSIDPDGPQCLCGSRGCLETLVSVPRLLSDVAQAGAVAELGTSSVKPVSPTLDDVVGRALAGDPIVTSAVGEMTKRLAVAVTNLVNTFDPEAVVIGGPVARLGDRFMIPFREAMAARAHPLFADKTRLVLSRYSQDAVARGAAMLVVEDFFESPQRYVPGLSGTQVNGRSQLS